MSDKRTASLHQVSHPAHVLSKAQAWGNVVIGALLMLATLPGRTQGLGLITESLLRDLSMDRVTFANINLWATLAGSLFCFPAGWIIDRFGLRKTAIVLTLMLATVVWQMSAFAGGMVFFFTLVTLSRGLGQSAMSVASITTVGKTFGGRSNLAMGVYSVLLSIFFAIAFLKVGSAIREEGWRVAWGGIAAGLAVIAVIVGGFLRESGTEGKSSVEPVAGLSLGAALRTPFFWVFAVATALFGLAFSGLGLFNEAVLAERGFDQETFHTFQAVTTVFALVGQILCGWLSQRVSMPRLLAAAMFLYATGLATLPLLQTRSQLWIFSGIFGMAAGSITVLFFAAWGAAFGRAELGRIQGMAQMIAVIATAVGPLLYAKTHATTGSYAPALYALAVVVFFSGMTAWRTRLPRIGGFESP